MIVGAAWTARSQGQTTIHEQGEAGSPKADHQGDILELRRQVEGALAHIDDLQNKLDKGTPESDLREELNKERTHLETIESQLNAIQLQISVQKSGWTYGRRPDTPPGSDRGLAPSDIYKNGFFVSTDDQSFSMYLNGFFQIRYTGFDPQHNVASFGASTAPTSNFDVYLGRLAASGSVFSPTLKYFLQFQGSTAGNGNGITLLDWFSAKSMSRALTLQAGRSWLPYTYEFYVNPGNLLLPDLPSAEFAFGLSRGIGLQVYGQADKFSYGAVIANSVPALDATSQENFTGKVAYIGHVQFDVLSPYGYVETDPDSRSWAKPGLTLWASAGYNPVSAASSFQNVNSGDRTANATSTVAFRYQRFTSQSTGYYRKTQPTSGRPDFNSWGFAQQEGFYVIPRKLEFAVRLSGVNWGAPNFLGPVASVNTWFSGPNFSYHRVDEDTLGLNLYFHGHNAKLQAAYSYLYGNGFDGRRFGANRVWAQTQVMF